VGTEADHGEEDDCPIVAGKGPGHAATLSAGPHVTAARPDTRPPDEDDSAESKWKGPRPTWFEPQWDFVRNANAVAVFDEPRRRALHIHLGNIIEFWRTRLDGLLVALPRYDVASARSIDLFCAGVGRALAEQIVKPLLSDVLAKVKECADSMGLRLDEASEGDIRFFGWRADVALNGKALTQALRRLRLAVGQGQRMIHGRKTWAYLGIGLRADEESERESQDSHLSPCPLNAGARE